MCERRLIRKFLALSALCCGIFMVALCLSEYTVSREGATNLHNCPAESYIPIYLIVVAFLTAFLVFVKKTIILPQEKKDAGSHASQFQSYVLFHFMTWCCIAGFCVWIYSVYKYNPDGVLSPNNCDDLYHLFVFRVMVVAIILMIIYLVIGFIAFIAIVVLPNICGPCVRDTCVTCCSCCECGRKLGERMSSTQSDDKNPSNSVPQSGSDPYTRY